MAKEQFKHIKVHNLPNWKKAIEATIKLHELSIELKYTYVSTKWRNIYHQDYKESSIYDSDCPLCNHTQKLTQSSDYQEDCEKCLWVKNTGAKCLEGHGIDDYHKNEESIKRLKSWLEKL